MLSLDHTTSRFKLNLTRPAEMMTYSNNRHHNYDKFHKIKADLFAYTAFGRTDRFIDFKRVFAKKKIAFEFTIMCYLHQRNWPETNVLLPSVITFIVFSEFSLGGNLDVVWCFIMCIGWCNKIVNKSPNCFSTLGQVTIEVIFCSTIIFNHSNH